MSSLIRLPLIITAIVVVARVLLEQTGAPSGINQIFGVAWLYFLVPIYFGMNLAAADHPYKALFKTLLCFVAYTRLMVMATYMAAYQLNWTAPRFSLEGGGVVGEDVSALKGLLVIPVRNLLIWIVIGTLVGMIIGSVVVAIKRRGAAAPA